MDKDFLLTAEDVRNILKWARTHNANRRHSIGDQATLLKLKKIRLELGFETGEVGQFDY